ncbi:MAG: CbiQ family ECF transporter T component [Nocardioidaceae bacterium]
MTWLQASKAKLPRQLISIMAMMVRYLDVVSDQVRRMRMARESRGFVARNPKHWLVLAQSAGALFVRSTSAANAFIWRWCREDSRARNPCSSPPPQQHLSGR